MINCPKCKREVTLKKWWQEHRLEYLLAYQARFVANNTGKGVDHTKLDKYKQSERLIRRCGFYTSLKEDNDRIVSETLKQNKSVNIDVNGLVESLQKKGIAISVSELIEQIENKIS